MHRNIGLGSWIARRALMTPDRIAVIAGDRRWTYRQLDERVTCLAQALLARGVDEGDRVAFLGHNHPAALETLFACGLIGAIAVPVHPGFDDSAIVALIEDAAPRAIVFTPDLAGAVARLGDRADGLRTIATGAGAPTAEPYEEIIRESSAEPIDRPIGLDAPCLIGFSSGTSGRNKGVVLTHGNLLFNAVNLLSCLDYLRDDVILTSAPLYRMGGLGFTLPLLLKGGCCVLQERADAELSLQLIARHRVSILFDAVHAMEALRRSPAFAGAELSSLRICVTGGSPVPPDLVEAFARRGLLLQPGYGLTEAAPLALLVDRDEVAAHPAAAGRPPLFGAIRIVDRDLEDVAPGETGELLYSGPNVMRGYWQRPDATSAALLADGWLRTGDAACAGADGIVQIVGRATDAVIVNGRALHPVALEHHLSASADIAECAVVQATAETTPVVCVVPDRGRTLDTDRLRALCSNLLPGEITIVCCDRLPRNPNGKLLRRQLVDRFARPSATTNEPLRRHNHS